MSYSAHTEAPEIMHFWAGVSTVAGALRRHVWIDMHAFRWVPNFYVILVAPAGIVQKSTTADLGVRLLRRVEGVCIGPSSITWQALTQSLAEATEMVKLPDESLLPMSCITISSSELGSFLNPQDREMVDVLTDLWDSKLGVWKRKTKFSGEDEIENPYINFIGCTTPSWIKAHVPDYVIGGGFTSRCVFVFAEEKRKLVPYTDEVIDIKWIKELEEQLVSDLACISQLVGPFQISDAARSWGRAWYEAHWDKSNRPIQLSSERFGGYIARKQTHIHKLAMVISASRGSDLVIHEDDLQTAEAFVTATEADMTKVFESIGMTPQTRNVQEIIAAVKAYGKITRRDLLRIMIRYMSMGEFDDAILSAINADFIIPATISGEPSYLYKGEEAVPDAKSKVQ